VAEFFESCIREYADAKAVCNWIVGEVFRLLKVKEKSIEQCRLTPSGLVGLLVLLDKGTVNMNTAKEVLEVMFDTGATAQAVVEERSLLQISDQDELSRIVDEVIAANPKPVADYLAGKQTAVGFLVGQVMRVTRGKANPNVVKELVDKRLRASG
jgi:aspartyl-tRNA(Asn)/glutamyl-tRNA(Gln) amidotransferase subunit B